MELNNKHKGYLVIVGGFLIHLVLGSFYLWGVINVYVTSYYRLHSDSSLEIKMTSALFPFMSLSISLSFFFSLVTIRSFKPRIVVTLEMILISATILISSFMSNFWLFMIFYGIIFGLFSGFVYIVPIFLSCQFFPEKKGVISGIITGGYGLATIFSSLIIQNIINPENKKASISYDGDNYFDSDVADNLPKAVRYLALYFLILGGIGGGMLMRSEKIKKEEQEAILENYQEQISENNDSLMVNGENNILKKENSYSISKLKILHIFLLNLLSSGYGLLLAGNLKNYGMNRCTSDDQFLTILISMCSLCNGGGRIIWGNLYDRFNFKKVYGFLLSLQLALASSIYYVSFNKSLFFIWSCLSLICGGGHFALFPALCLKEAGVTDGTKIYPYVYLAFPFSIFIQFGIVFFFKSQIGWDGIFWIDVGLTILAGFLMVFFKEKPKSK